MEEAESLLQHVWGSMQFLSFAASGEEARLWGDMEAFNLVVRIWLAEWSLEGNALASKLLAMCMLSGGLLASPEDLHAAKRRLLLEIASSTMDFSADDIMCLMLSRFRRAKIEEMTSYFGILMFLIGAINDIGAPDIKAFYRAFERHQGVWVSIKSTDKMLKRWNFNVDAPDASLVVEDDVEIISRCLGVLSLVFTYSPDLPVTLLKQALGRDLLRILACCSTQCIFSLLNKGTQNSIHTILAETLGGAFAIRSVVLAAQRSITKYQLSMGRCRSDEYKLSEVFPSLTLSGSRDVWENFFLRLYHQSSSFRMIAMERKGGGAYVCKCK